MSGVSKLTADRNQRILLDLVSRPGNDVCADCKARAPRWASHNLGIFICMNCASIHRKIGTHITKVKSVTMDSWSREQVEVMKSIGNIVSNAKYNPNEARNPPPANREESERDSELEKFIRWKYEFKRFVDKSANVSLTAKIPPARAQSTPVATLARKASPLPPLPTDNNSPNPVITARPPETRPYPVHATAPTAAPVPVPSQPSQPLYSATARPLRSFTSLPTSAPTPQSAPVSTSNHPVWNDIMSLATPSQGSPMVQFQQSSFASPGSASNPFGVMPPTNPAITSINNHTASRSSSLPPIPTSMGNPFQQQSAQPQFTAGNPFIQQPSGFPGQMLMAGSPFQPSPTPSMSRVPFGQPSSAPFPPSYTPPAFQQQQQQQQQQQFAPSPFPSQFVQPQTHMQEPPQAFPQQPSMQGGSFGAPVQWQQQQPPSFSGQPQYGQWGNM